VISKGGTKVSSVTKGSALYRSHVRLRHDQLLIQINVMVTNY
jgi:hypothetical protein